MSEESNIENKSKITEDKPKKTAKKSKKKSKGGFLVSVIWFLGLGSIFGATAFMYAISIGIFGELPDIEALENPQINLATEIISSDQVILGTYYLENRSNVKYDQLSPHLVKALIATEDVRFYEHSGIDFKGLARAIAYGGTNGGASTVTQQLAKNLFHGTSRTLTDRLLQKLKEWKNIILRMKSSLCILTK